MLDIKWIKANPEKFDQMLIARGLEPCTQKLLELDQQNRELVKQIQFLQAERNKKAEYIRVTPPDTENYHNLRKEAEQVRNEVVQLEKMQTEDNRLQAMLEILPNILDEDVPFGTSESDNKEISKWGNIRNFSFAPQPHYELGTRLGMMDFVKTAQMSGSRFVTLSRDLAKLERALAHFMLELHIKEFGYAEHSPPLLVLEEAMYAAGKLPKFRDDLFKVEDKYMMIPTSEVSLVNLVKDQIFAPTDLPIRMVAHTPCFRSEAGSAGKDTRGIIRLHQFSKVELVSITTPSHSKAEHELITMHAEEVLKRLELPFRKMLLCTADTGASSIKQYDLEVWLPSQETYREISSCSNCGDFQARRLNARIKEADQRYFAHTLNGSGLAIGRTLAAILENYQNEDGSIIIPNVLRSYMGADKIVPVT